MEHLQWVAQESHRIHDWLQGIFYLLVTVFLVIGVLIEYFNFPLGGTPSFGPLVGRALVAVILLYTYPEIANLMADLADGISAKLGDLTQFKNALDRLGEKVDQLSWSWVSIRQNILVAASLLCFFLLYFSLHVAEAAHLFTIVVLYIFSPILIALFVLPNTAGATKGLYKSLIEASLWKPVWCVVGTILWTTGLTDIQTESSTVSFLSAICFCLIASGSLLATPLLVHSLAGAGMSAMAQNFGSIGLPGLGSFTPMGAMSKALNITRRSANAGLDALQYATKGAPKVNRVVSKAPRFNVPPRKPILKWKKTESAKFRSTAKKSKPVA